ADVHRLTSYLDAACDQIDTADHRGKDRAASCGRIARMIGRDAREAPEADWLDLARTFRAAQLRLIEASVTQVLAATSITIDAPVVAAGSGDFLAREIAVRLQRTCIEFERLLDARDGAG